MALILHRYGEDMDHISNVAVFDTAIVHDTIFGNPKTPEVVDFDGHAQLDTL